VPKECKPYQETTSDELGERAAASFTYELEPADDPEQVVFSGACPRCEKAMTFAWPLIVVRSMDVPADELTVTMVCRCVAKHRGADGEKGCGAYWSLRIPRP
jgi:hypothetical protein